MGNKLHILGLGAGSLDQMPYGVYKKIKSIGTVYTRTLDHPVIKELQEEGITFIGFDAVYEKHGRFQDVYEEISDTLIEEAGSRDIVYTVPGHPMVAEMTVQLLLEKAKDTGIELSVEGGQSFLDALFTAVKIDPIDGFQLLDGTALATDELQITQHIIIGQVYDAYTASEVKLTLMEKYPDEYEVAVVTAAGSQNETVEWMPLYELDRMQGLSNLTSVYVPPVKEEQLLYREFSYLQGVIAALRGPNGCPWDQKQTHESLKKYAIEEVYELLDAITAEDTDAIISELGDVLLQVMLHAQIGDDEGMFAIEDVIQSLTEKMINRHPHVFGETEVKDAEEVVRNWDQIKRKEKEDAGMKEESLLDGIEQSLPQTLVAYDIQKRAAKVGFDWKETEPMWDKVNEEIREFQEEVTVEDNEEEMKREYGDILFALINLGRFYKISPEEALHETNMKFIRRFKYMEEKLKEAGKSMEACSLDELDVYWNEAKVKGI